MLTWATPLAGTKGQPGGSSTRQGAPNLNEQALQWMTPMSNDGRRVSVMKRGNHSLPSQVKEWWPTPVASENANRTTREPPSTRGVHGRHLSVQAVAMSRELWPTPNASGANDGEDPSQWWARKQLHATKDDPTRAGMPLTIAAQVIQSGLRAPPTLTGGEPISNPSLVLNPRFHEALMGWPIGWTSSELPATESYRSWLQSHSSYLREILGY